MELGVFLGASQAPDAGADAVGSSRTQPLAVGPSLANSGATARPQTVGDSPSAGEGMPSYPPGTGGIGDPDAELPLTQVVEMLSALDADEWDGSLAAVRAAIDALGAFVPELEVGEANPTAGEAAPATDMGADAVGDRESGAQPDDDVEGREGDEEDCAEPPRLPPKPLHPMAALQARLYARCAADRPLQRATVSRRPFDLRAKGGRGAVSWRSCRPAPPPEGSAQSAADTTNTPTSACRRCQHDVVCQDVHLH